MLVDWGIGPEELLSDPIEVCEFPRLWRKFPKPWRNVPRPWRIREELNGLTSASEIAGMRTGDNASLHAVDAFLDGESWDEVPVIARLEATLASGMWELMSTLVSACFVTT